MTGAAENKKDDKVAAENVTIGFDDGENDGDTTENPFDNIDIASDTDFAFSVFVEGSSAESGDDEDYGQMLFDEDHLGGSLINFTSSNNGDVEGASADNVSSIAIVPTDSPVASEVTTTAQHITETTQSTTPIVVSVNDPTTTIKVSNRAIVTTFLPFIVFTAILIVLLRLGKLFIDLLTI